MSSTRIARPVSSASRSVAAAAFRAAAASRHFHSSPARMVVHEVTSAKQFSEFVENKDNKIVLVDSFATWCGPCKAISPILEKLSESDEFKDKVDFVKFDVDKLPELTQELGVRAMPTFFLFKDGSKAGEVVGANPPAIVQLLSSNI